MRLTDVTRYEVRCDSESYGRREKLGSWAACTERTAQGKDLELEIFIHHQNGSKIQYKTKQELILMVKMETRHPVEGQFGVNFRRSAIIAEL